MKEMDLLFSLSIRLCLSGTTDDNVIIGHYRRLTLQSARTSLFIYQDKVDFSYAVGEVSGRVIAFAASTQIQVDGLGRINISGDACTFSHDLNEKREQIIHTEETTTFFGACS